MAVVIFPRCKGKCDSIVNNGVSTLRRIIPLSQIFYYAPSYIFGALNDDVGKMGFMLILFARVSRRRERQLSAVTMGSTRE